MTAVWRNTRVSGETCEPALRTPRVRNTIHAFQLKALQCLSGLLLIRALSVTGTPGFTIKAAIYIIRLMDCPRCHLINPSETILCDCVYNSTTGAIDPRKQAIHLAERRNGHESSVLLWVLQALLTVAFRIFARGTWWLVAESCCFVVLGLFLLLGERKKWWWSISAVCCFGVLLAAWNWSRG